MAKKIVKTKAKANFIFLVFLFFIVLMKNLIVSVIFTSFSLIQTDFNLNDAQLGCLTSVYYLFDLIFIIFWVYLFGKGYNPNKCLMIGSINWITPLFLIYFFANGYVSLLIFIMIIGIGIESTLIYFFYNFVYILEPSKLGKGFAVYVVLQGSGGVFGVFFTGILESTYNLNWREIFLILGIAAACIIISMGILIRSKKLVHYSNGQNPEEFQNPYDMRKSSLKELWDNPINRLIIIMGLIFGFMISMLAIWQITYLQRVHSLNQLQASITYIFNSGAEVLGTITGGILVDKMVNPNKYIKGYILFFCYLVASGFFFLGFSLQWQMPTINEPNFVMMCWKMFLTAISNIHLFFGFISLFLAFFISTISNVVIFVIIADFNKAKTKGTMYAIINFELLFGSFVGPYIGGLISDSFSLTLTMYIVPICYLILLIPLSRIIKISGKLTNPDKKTLEKLT